MARKPGPMGNIGDETFNRTNSELSDAEAELLTRTSVDWEALRPNIQDQATFDKLIEAVKQSTARNENLAELKNRIIDIGEAGISIASTVAKLIP